MFLIDYYLFSIVLVIVGVFLFLGYRYDDKAFKMLGSLLLMAFGVYIVLNGFPVVDSEGNAMTLVDSPMFEAVWYMLIGLGGYVFVKASIDAVQEGF